MDESRIIGWILPEDSHLLPAALSGLSPEATWRELSNSVKFNVDGYYVLWNGSRDCIAEFKQAPTNTLSYAWINVYKSSKSYWSQDDVWNKVCQLAQEMGLVPLYETQKIGLDVIVDTQKDRGSLTSTNFDESRIEKVLEEGADTDPVAWIRPENVSVLPCNIDILDSEAQKPLGSNREILLRKNEDDWIFWDNLYSGKGNNFDEVEDLTPFFKKWIESPSSVSRSRNDNIWPEVCDVAERVGLLPVYFTSVANQIVDVVRDRGQISQTHFDESSETGKSVLPSGQIQYCDEDGSLHREDGPAVICKDGYKAWYKNGDRHRVDGPAVEWPNGRKEYWLNGEEVEPFANREDLSTTHFDESSEKSLPKVGDVFRATMSQRVVVYGSENNESERVNTGDELIVTKLSSVVNLGDSVFCHIYGTMSFNGSAKTVLLSKSDLDAAWEKVINREDLSATNFDESQNSEVVRAVQSDGIVTYRNQQGKLHREDGPAVIYTNGDKEWRIDGELHREGGPAIEDKSTGYWAWFKNGKRHREDGPAADWGNGIQKWYIDGVETEPFKSREDLTVTNFDESSIAKLLEEEEGTSPITFEDLHKFITGDGLDGELISDNEGAGETGQGEPPAEEPNPYAVEAWWYCVVDGDHIGNEAAIPLLNDDEEKAARVSRLIHKGQDFIDGWVHERDGVLILDGGDNAVFKFPQSNFKDDEELKEALEDLKDGYKDLTDFTLSVGVSEKMSYAAKCLLVAKFRGRDRIVKWDDTVEDDLEKAKGSSSEEDKIRKEMGLK